MVAVATSVAVQCVIGEMLEPLNALVGSYRILKDKVPPIISVQMSNVGKASDQLVKEVLDIRDHLSERINVQSPVRAAERIREIASRWNIYEAVLSSAISQIQVIGIRLEDPQLDEILNGVLPRGLEQLKNTIARLETIQSEELVP